MRKLDNLSEWYLDVCQKADLFDYGPVKGTMIFKPNGYALWEKVRQNLDPEIKKSGAKNVYFPMFIPESFLKKEKEHVEGFAPEVALVTHAGGKKLTEPLVIRPTSETIMYASFAKWIHSYRDLPYKINQWSNVVRWELRTLPFLRTSEFLWQEGHTVHATAEEAEIETADRLAMYADFYQNVMALPGIVGRKSDLEKFAGAVYTLSYETLMPDGKALQMCTSHFLGQNFSKTFNVCFQDKDRKQKFAWQTSWGLSTRALGALVMVHGDDRGLILPPKMAPSRFVVIPIFKTSETAEKTAAMEMALGALQKAGYSDVLVDLDPETSVGWKFNQYELLGIPIRIEIGPKEMKKNKMTLVRRDTGEKIETTVSKLGELVNNVLAEMHDNLFEQAKAILAQNTYEVQDYDEFKKIIDEYRGFVFSPWCEKADCELKVKQETKATIRVIPFEQPKTSPKKCLVCGKRAKIWAVWARAY